MGQIRLLTGFLFFLFIVNAIFGCDSNNDIIIKDNKLFIGEKSILLTEKKDEILEFLGNDYEIEYAPDETNFIITNLPFVFTLSEDGATFSYVGIYPKRFDGHITVDALNESTKMKDFIQLLDVLGVHYEVEQSKSSRFILMKNNPIAFIRYSALNLDFPERISVRIQ